MAKKAAKKVDATKSVRSGRPVRLDLTEADHKRLERIARDIGLNKAAFARMALMERLTAEEAKRGGG